jgi:hypothetical protein
MMIRHVDLISLHATHAVKMKRAHGKITESDLIIDILILCKISVDRGSQLSTFKIWQPEENRPSTLGPTINHGRGRGFRNTHRKP